MPESKTAHDMCISCDFFSMEPKGCRNKSLFFGRTQVEEIQEARENMAQGKGCNQAEHLGAKGSMMFEDNQWKFIPDLHQT